MKNFNLAEFEKGVFDLQTRDGRAVNIDHIARCGFTPIKGWINGEDDIDEWTKSGSYLGDGRESDKDLMMLTIQV